MRAYLTEWLILYGTGWIDGLKHPQNPLWNAALKAGYIDHEPAVESHTRWSQERITPKGLEYIKDESISD